MKKITIAVILFFLFIISSKSPAQSADDIINKHIEAIGGLDVIKSIKTMKLSGTVAVSGFNLPLTITFKRKLKVRLEVKFQELSQVQAFDGKEAWQTDISNGGEIPEKMSDKEAEDLKTTADFEGLMVNYKKKGYNASLIGKEKLDSAETYKISIANKSGDSVYYYIEMKTFLVLKRTKISKDHITDTYYKNYNEYSGLILPTSLDVNPEGAEESQKVIFDKIEINLKVDDSIFKMPELKEK